MIAASANPVLPNPNLSETSQELTRLFIDTQTASWSNEMHKMTKQGEALYTN